jgi:predicted RNA-binding Zn-ribbon protein involved in translation (DUF1610 family)
MLEIPLGKAVVPVEVEKTGYCPACCFYSVLHCHMKNLNCTPDAREDGKRVIFKLIDWPEEKVQPLKWKVVEKEKHVYLECPKCGTDRIGLSNYCDSCGQRLNPPYKE